LGGLPDSPRRYHDLSKEPSGKFPDNFPLFDSINPEGSRYD